MKVYVGPYITWIGPYQLAEMLMWWYPKQTDEYGIKCSADCVHKFGDWLAYGFKERIESNQTILYNFLEWIHSKKKQKVKVKIDKYDTWSADVTLAHIIVPLLIELKKEKHGAPFVDNDDVPDNLRNKNENQQFDDVDDNWFLRWDWIIDEMIWAFQQKLIDGEDEFFKELPSTPDKPFNFEIDKENLDKYHERINNGLRLFGKYYHSLWT